MTPAESDVEFASPLAECDTLSPPCSLTSCRVEQGSTRTELCSTVNIRYLPCFVPAAAVRNGRPSASDPVSFCFEVVPSTLHFASVCRWRPTGFLKPIGRASEKLAVQSKAANQKLPRAQSLVNLTLSRQQEVGGNGNSSERS